MIVNDQTRWSYFNELKRGNKCSEVPRLFRVWSVLPLAIPGDWDQAGGSFGIEEERLLSAVALNAATIQGFDAFSSGVYSATLGEPESRL